MGGYESDYAYRNEHGSVADVLSPSALAPAAWQLPLKREASKLHQSPILEVPRSNNSREPGGLFTVTAVVGLVATTLHRLGKQPFCSCHVQMLACWATELSENTAEEESPDGWESLGQEIELECSQTPSTQMEKTWACSPRKPQTQRANHFLNSCACNQKTSKYVWMLTFLRQDKYNNAVTCSLMW